jgi:hypothetical protein
MKYKFLVRRVTLLVFDDNDPINYAACCQININGTHGTIDSLVGKSFYEFLHEYGYKPFSDLGLVEVSAAMTPAHLRLLKMYLKDIDTVCVDHIEEPEPDGSALRLCWVKMIQKKPA